MTRILRHEVPVDDAPHTIVGHVLHVETRHDSVVEVWTLDLGDDQPVNDYVVVGTGHPFDVTTREYIGSAVTPSGRFVWHLLRVLS